MTGPGSATVVVNLGWDDAAILLPVVVGLVEDQGRPLDERAAWLGVGVQLARQLAADR